MRSWNRSLLALTGNLAFVFPLFLACREVALARRTPASSIARPASTPGGQS